VTLSVVLCVYNGKARIGAVLDALAAQDCRQPFQLIVVDNNSTDGTADYVASHPSVERLRLRDVDVQIVSESRQGLMFARLAGVAAASGEFVCFLDDDNVPAPGYVSAGIGVLLERPDIGLLVSRLRPRFEVPPPEAVRRRKHLFAINEELGAQIVDFGADASLAPTLGAGLWVRRSAFLAAVPWRTPERMIPDRLGTSTISGNDIEIGYLIGRAGHGRLYVPALEMDHCIPAGRLKTRYMTRLIMGVVRSAATLEAVYVGEEWLGDRLFAGVRLMGAIVAAPGLMVLRKDGLREAWFAIVSRYSSLRGPYAEIARRMRGGRRNSSTVSA
jgi:glycosyltransferase involved in cell wall biosynthesis